MVVSEVALALTLLVGAGLMIQTIYRLRYHDIGLKPDNVLTARTVLPRQKYNSFPKRRAFYDQVLERLENTPGVISAGYSTTVPLEWKGGTNGFYIQGREPDPVLSYDANHRQISPNYFKTVGIPLLEGRFFEPTDSLGATNVTIVNQTMAQQYWPGESAIDKQFKLGDPDSENPWLTIVGVVGDVRQMGLELPVKAEMYFPYRQAVFSPWFAPRDLVVKTSSDPMSLVASVKEVIHQVDPEQPVAIIRTLNEILDEDVSQRRLGTTLLTVFAVVALLLASLGIYGVLSYLVVQETPEIGVRLALGAQASDILGLVLRKGMILALAGVVVGLGASILLTRLMSSFLRAACADSVDRLLHTRSAGNKSRSHNRAQI
jgi:putative ABC transport system permease protein